MSDENDVTDQVDQDLTEGFKEELLQQFPDGSTLVLTSDSMQLQSDEGVDDEMVDPDATQHFVEEIIGDTVEDDPDGDDVETQQIHVDADGNHQLITSSMHDLITLHAVDSQGNIISSEGGGEEEVLGDHVGLQMDQVTMESMMDSDNIVEEVIASGQQEDDSYLTGDAMGGTVDMQHQFLNVQEAIFNPNTGTLQPINQGTHATTATTTTKTVKKTKQTQQAVTKYIIAQQPGSEMGGQTQQIILDANSLQTLIQGGGNISFGGASGKNLILAPSSPQKKGAVKSPAKILPAPVPIGDQQQATSTQKFLLKQGTVLTPITPMNQGGARYIQMNTGTPGNQEIKSPDFPPLSARSEYQDICQGGKQIQYLRVIPNKSSNQSNKIAIAPALKPKPVAPKPTPGQQTIILPAGTTSADLANFQNSQGLGNFVIMPNYMVKSEQNTPVPIRPAETQMQSVTQGVSLMSDSSNILGSIGQNMSSGQNQSSFESFRSLLEPNGMRPRKPCNCTKSACLKLYCDCFANGEFCHLCNCTNCFNNLNHEEDRQKAIKLVLERNPGAFRPKIGKSSQSGEAHERRHNKGCNCRRSGCLKNYCECYEAKIFCSGICKCTGCKNCIENIPSGLPNGVGVEQHFAGAGTSHRQTLKDLAEAAEVRVQQQNQVKNKMRAQMQEVSPQNNLGIMVPPLVFKYPHGSISYEVVTSTVELLLAKAEVAEKQKLPEGEIERLILEEFGDCLSAVMDLGSTVE